MIVNDIVANLQFPLIKAYHGGNEEKIGSQHVGREAFLGDKVNKT